MARVSRGKKGESSAPTATDAGASSRNVAAAQQATDVRPADLGGDGPFAASGADVAAAGATEDAVLAPAMAVSATAALLTQPQHETPAADRRDQATPHPRTLSAYIDKENGDRIAGWVYDPQQPHEVIAREL